MTEQQRAAKRAASKAWHAKHRDYRRRYIQRWRFKNPAKVEWYGAMQRAKRKEALNAGR
jgi:hypothetical protein